MRLISGFQTIFLIFRRKNLIGQACIRCVHPFQSAMGEGRKEGYMAQTWLLLGGGRVGAERVWWLST